MNDLTPLSEAAPLLAGALVVGIVLGWGLTRLWAGREIRRAARFGDRRLRTAEFAVERYRERLDEAAERVAELEDELDRARADAATPASTDPLNIGPGRIRADRRFTAARATHRRKYGTEP